MNKFRKMLCTVLTSLFVFLPLSGCKKEEKTKLKISEVTHSVFYAPLYLADALGYFENENIQIELTNGGGADNVMAAVLLGAEHATAIGFIIACLRNMFGTGSLLAFPGSMVGACVAGILYQRYKTLSMAVVGEIFGTGILGGFLAWCIAYFILGSSAVAWFFIPPFLISSIGGSLIALALLKSGVLQHIAIVNKK